MNDRTEVMKYNDVGFLNCISTDLTHVYFSTHAPSTHFDLATRLTNQNNGDIIAR